MTKTIDLNADLGEGAGEDSALLGIVSSCSIACGGHAGTAETMRETLRMAMAQGVVCGAHPSYPDREGFGRRSLAISEEALRTALLRQVGELKAIANEEGVTLKHLKPHGALYNDAARERRLADIVASVLAGVLPGAALVGPPRSNLQDAAARSGLPFMAEGFIDRAYRSDGILVPRGEPDALITESGMRRDQAVRLARGEPVDASGGPLTLQVETLCIHGDSEGAAATALDVREALEEAGFEISRTA